MATFEFKLPDIGEGVTEGEIVTWLVKLGEVVAEDQDMVEVMTDKATVTISAPKAGTVAKLGGQEGDVVPVGHVLVVLDLGAAAAEASSAASATPATAVGDLKDVLPGLPRDSGPTLKEAYFNERPLAAPATRKLARELGVDLRHVRPSGPGGRVTREDVEGSRDTGRQRHVPLPAADPLLTERAPPPVSGAPPSIEPAPPTSITGSALDQRVPIRGLRKRIFENMARSKHTAAHFTYVEECDAEALISARARAKKAAERAGVKLNYLPFIIKAVVLALRRHPALNALVDDSTREIVRKASYDIGIAAATEAGLTVPVLRGADRLSILDIAREVDRLAGEARAGKTRREDIGGSSFTITSLGRLGGLFATPVVNYPEVAILGVHEIKRRPVVRGDLVVPGDVMLLSLSFDHRIIDGHVGAAFAREVVDYLEAPDSLLIELR